MYAQVSQNSTSVEMMLVIWTWEESKKKEALMDRIGEGRQHLIDLEDQHTLISKCGAWLVKYSTKSTYGVTMV